MKDIIQKLISIPSPSGFEEKLREQVAKLLEGKIGEVDFMGNLVVKHPGKGPKILVEAQMDEDSIIVNHVDKNGFIRFYPSTAMKEADILNRQVIFPSGACGYIGAEEVAEGTVLGFDKMFVDIGAHDKKTAMKMVQIGDHASFHTESRLEGGRVIGASNCKVPVAVLTWLANEYDGDANLVYAFTAQGRLGGRGAAAIITRENPDIIVTIDSTPATDTPNCPDKAKIDLDAGPVLVVKGNIVPRDMSAISIFEEVAEASGIQTQRTVKDVYDMHDMRIARLVSSASIITVGIPTRRFGIFGSVSSVSDAQAAGKLLSKALRKKLVK
jgi:putative aminopeptidase FrvX